MANLILSPSTWWKKVSLEAKRLCWKRGECPLAYPPTIRAGWVTRIFSTLIKNCFHQFENWVGTVLNFQVPYTFEVSCTQPECGTPTEKDFSVKVRKIVEHWPPPKRGAFLSINFYLYVDNAAREATVYAQRKNILPHTRQPFAHTLLQFSATIVFRLQNIEIYDV